uniref:Metabotropic glutamate receptor 6-like n=1 Tax=Crassostrea virginica TaxID=6565 RepID=A0A8B8EB37_CRAVI|nr:metabotropic glutamate receptor 6-like [Crassostrea virginica]XP_022336895.1 metabotropic glutamate receptor 6-like [Crassostrea virginica]
MVKACNMDLLVVILVSVSWSFCQGQASEKKQLRIDGDFIVGALFPIHDCRNGQINEQDGIQILEAAVFALEEVNKELKLKGLTLGLIARDSCYDTSIALEHALEYAQRRINSNPLRFENCTCTSSVQNNIIGVIGPPRSKETINVALLLTLFKVPQISYFATSPELSDNVKYKYFKRTVPSDMYQAKGLVSILSSFGWDYVNIIYEDSNYGINGYTEIKLAAEDAGICFGFDSKVKESDSDEDLKVVVDKLMERKNTKGQVLTVLFTQYALAYRIIERASTIHSSKGAIWIGGDAWIGREPPSDQESLIHGAIGISPETEKYQGFAEYFRKQTLENNKINPWFDEYLRQRYNCSMTSKKVNCASIKINDFEELLTAYNVRNAVYAFGSAIERIHTSLCHDVQGVCKAMSSALTGEMMLGFLANVSDPYNSKFHFVNGVDGPVRYSVLQYEDQQGGGYGWVEKGKFSVDDISWSSEIRPQQRVSVCSSPCKKGEFRSRTSACCWECRECAYTDVVNATNPFTCIACKYGWAPNLPQNACVAIPVQHLAYDNPYVVVILVLSSLGIGTCLIVSIVFVFKRATPIVKATGFETSLVLLVGILFSYISPFIIVMEPSEASCSFFRIFLGLSYTMAYSAILSKLMVYNRAFDVQSSIKNKSIQGNTIVCTIKTALVISLSLSAIHLLAIVFWIIGDIPTPVVSYSVTREAAFGNRSCVDLRNFSYFVCLGWSFLLMIACLGFAIKTRKLPDGMNDSHEIMYCSFTSFVLWIAFVPLYAFSENKVVKVMSLSISLIIHGTVCLLCLFITKIYIVVCRPEKNNKERVMRTSPSRSRDSYSGSYHGSHAAGKRPSFGLTLEDKTSTTASRKPSTACVADDTEEEVEDYSATTGTLPFRNSSTIVDRSEMNTEDVQIVLTSFSRNSGEKLLGNENDVENSEPDNKTIAKRLNGSIPRTKSSKYEEMPQHIPSKSSFQKSIGFKTPQILKPFASRTSEKSLARSDSNSDGGNQQDGSSKAARRLSQSLPEVNHQNNF